MLGIFLGYLFFTITYQSTDLSNYDEIRDKSYTFISPLLECNANPSKQKNVSSLEKDINQKIQRSIEQESFSSVSVYFRDLNNGPWFIINEDEKYSPASLLKVLNLMAFLKEAENNPNLLKQEIVFKKGPNYNLYSQFFNTPDPLIENQSYNVEELLERMILFSDNDTTDTLIKNTVIESYDLDSLLLYLNIELPEQQAENFMNVKDYATFFRILYNSSYLSRDMSEKALEILSRSSFKDGLVADIDPEILVAHKFGEGEITNKYGNKTRQLHDCGIIYIPEKPYLLCIITEGEDFEKLSEIIKEISKITYDSITK